MITSIFLPLYVHITVLLIKAQSSPDLVLLGGIVLDSRRLRRPDRDVQRKKPKADFYPEIAFSSARAFFLLCFKSLFFFAAGFSVSASVRER